ncbi:hypothetical protein GJ688_04195 [Heliobacillus mobilis]|uniref:Secreted protein containing C-terminal beta-propeller domain n=1 Tax=Heliobacterium mobile TaxID=28064 RepID=A0A6I3SH53_HELMO|nr:beta-propeller domain-containing protein [Heliobacterium mobile]MTV48184.1 hypothetical protein [Heliobacterium mobile]
MKKLLTSKGWLTGILALTLFSAGCISSVGASATAADTQKELSVVGSYANLKKLVEKARTENDLTLYGGVRRDRLFTTAAPTQAPKAEASKSAAADGSALASGDYSKTNVQVDGVDEADIVKTDGRYIYQVNKQRVVIAEAYPPEEMKLAATINLEDQPLSPREIYVDKDYLVVIGDSRYDTPVLVPEIGAQSKMLPGWRRPPYHPYPLYGSVKALIYDIRDKGNIRKTREVELEGNYVSSRKIDASLYLVTDRQLGYYLPETEDPTILPWYKDSVSGTEKILMSYDKIRCFPDFVQPNYLLVAGFDVTDTSRKVNVSTYLGSGQEVYASLQNLYVAVTHYQRQAHSGITVPYGGQAAEKTRLYKFRLNQANISYQEQGEVPGRILNQFSMDESGDYFRVATTVGSPWEQGEGTSKNNLYILNSHLTQVGKLEGIAPGEQIYSVRFMGERAYVVTFRTVDPLFVIDLKVPQTPKILGALKIPGYSNYLHPYDENHIIGFGKDTVEQVQKDSQGNEVGVSAFYLGMKMAIFDVTDVNHPVEQFTANIGDRGTDSDLLHNHKAMLFDKQKNLLAFPVRVMVVDSNHQEQSGIPEYGTFTFQGAYVYRVDLEKGFELKGKITHLTQEDYDKAGMYWYNSDNDIQRILYVGDTLYTLSNNKIKANAIVDLKDQGTLTIK